MLKACAWGDLIVKLSFAVSSCVHSHSLHPTTMYTHTVFSKSVLPQFPEKEGTPYVQV